MNKIEWFRGTFNFRMLDARLKELYTNSITIKKSGLFKYPDGNRRFRVYNTKGKNSELSLTTKIFYQL
jgi:hypothetical protein